MEEVGRKGSETKGQSKDGRGRKRDGEERSKEWEKEGRRVKVKVEVLRR